MLYHDVDGEVYPSEVHCKTCHLYYIPSLDSCITQTNRRIIEEDRSRAATPDVFF